MEGTDEESTDEDDSGMLPPIKMGEKLNYAEINATEKYTHHPPRFTEASLVKKLEELGIGRPSTYAPTISTVQKRNYVVKEDREGKPRNYFSLSLIKKKLKKRPKLKIQEQKNQKCFQQILEWL